ncbi:MAG: hypothetical protein QOD76_584 [Solirubrobacteraceae bacterium]|jgi:hypothetical protein|nr:hypothetical protein [Solirubrobacteraceae bacterium]
MRSRSPILVLVFVIGLALAPPALAGRTVTAPSYSGNFNEVFVFVGKGWQPRQKMTVNYFADEATKTPFNSYSKTPDRKGQFTFRFTNPTIDATIGRTEKLCFRQFDTRTKKTYQRCARFYVQPANARLEPDSFPRGSAGLLHISGWAPGTALGVEVIRSDGLNIQFTRPDGTVGPTYPVTTRQSAGYIDRGQPWGNVFVPVGGQLLRIDVGTDQPAGIWSVYVHLANDARAGSRTAFKVT